MNHWRENASGPAALASVALHVAVLAWALAPFAREPAPPVVRTITVTLLDAPVPVVARLAPSSPTRHARAAEPVAATRPVPTPAPVLPVDAPVLAAPAAIDPAASAPAIATTIEAPSRPARADLAVAASTGAVPSAAPAVSPPSRTVVALLERSLPVYPSMSRRLRETGRVLLDIVVGVDGRAQAVTVLESSGHGRLDAAAIDAVRRWRFAPARVSGTAVVAHVHVPVVFELDDGGRAGA